MSSSIFSQSAIKDYIFAVECLYRFEIIDKKGYEEKLNFLNLNLKNHSLQYKDYIKLRFSRFKIRNARHKITSYILRDTNLRRWEFHKYDDDFFPSVPHGHKIDCSEMKLDVYNGSIYINQNLIKKEKKKNIIELWNNDSFRKFALESIMYYLRKYPKFRWRVPNPKKLPKRRKFNITRQNVTTI